MTLRKMLSGRTLILYPFVFAANTVITKDVPLAGVLLLLTPVLLTAAVVFGITNRFTKDIHRSGFLTVLAMGWAMYYGAAYAVVVPRLGLDGLGLYRHVLFFIFWTLGVLFLGSRWLWQKIGTGRRATSYLNMVTVTVFVLFGYNVARIKTHDFITPADRLDARISRPAGDTSTPDIYYIILDAYDRADILMKHGFDNSEFTEFLGARGFFVADRSLSNYTSTEYSLASSLNMSYLESLPNVTIAHASAMHALISGSQVRSILTSIGYRFITFSTPFYPTDITNADVVLSASGGDSYLDFLRSQFVPSSIAAIPVAAGLFSTTGETYRDHQQRVMYMFQQLGTIPSVSGPKFVFAHFMVPHGPYVFDHYGPITPDEPLLPGWLSAEQNMAAYLEVITYINPLVEQMVDAILENSSSPPIIIIQSDHGSRLSAPDIESCPQDWYSILNAYYVPEDVADALYETISPVNTFRVIFNEYFGAHFDVLEDRQFTASGYVFTDVTETEYTCLSRQ